MRTLSLLLVTCGLLAGCGLTGASDAAEPSPTAMADAEILSIGKEVATCIRSNGVPEFPDPYVEEGHLLLPDQVEQDIEAKYPEDVLERALAACQSIMDRLPESALKSDGGGESTGEPGPPTAEDVDALRKFAQCMRDNGVPDWPDPKADGSFPLAGSPIETEGKSPRIIAGFDACGKHYDGKLAFS
ncbi:hypothetical protein GCM10022251_36620 [Phytohabitans flavus]|uniref:Lipoprotein n=1 Tax=Phytohabitans flavus TaxID=1076124 RepID=A0A6F8XW28_9ACTN|nr:hypothetical protein [Phytohabitans flavus]BCB78036.1 hypothetical protein Pflav_044460 [Phytohabitans flavus]